MCRLDRVGPQKEFAEPVRPASSVSAAWCGADAAKGAGVPRRFHSQSVVVSAPHRAAAWRREMLTDLIQITLVVVLWDLLGRPALFDPCGRSLRTQLKDQSR